MTIQLFILDFNFEMNWSHEHNNCVLVDEILPNEIFYYRTSTIQNNEQIQNFIKKLNDRDIKVTFHRFYSVANRMIIFDSCKKQIQIIEIDDHVN